MASRTSFCTGILLAVLRRVPLPEPFPTGQDPNRTRLATIGTDPAVAV